MGVSRVLLLGFCVVVFVACENKTSQLAGHSLALFQQAIINGDQCLANEDESAVELYVDAQVDFGALGVFRISNMVCGGTLIAPDVVLTAAHCLDPESLTQGVGHIDFVNYYVTWDKDLSYIDSIEGAAVPKNAVAVTKTMIEEGFVTDETGENGLGNYRDVGLLFLQAPLQMTPAIVITKEEAQQIVKGKSVTIAGWGQRVAGDSNSDARIDPKLFGIKFCARTTINETGSHEMQVGSDENSARKCFGDSGGPTYMQVMTEDGPQTRVIGITSHSYDDSTCEKGGVDTRVDAWLDWIDEKMRMGCLSKERVWCEVEGIIPPKLPAGYIEQILAYIRALLT